MSLPQLLFFTLVNLLNYLDRWLMSSVNSLIQSDLKLSYEATGFLTNSYVIGYVLLAPIFGTLGDRYSRPKLMALGIFLWSIATFGTAFATSVTLLLAARIAVGIGEASFGTIAPGFIKDRIGDPIKLNSMLAIFYVAIPVGAALAYVVGGIIAARYSWHTVFLVGGLPGMILAFFFLPIKEKRSTNEPPPALLPSLLKIVRTRYLRYAILGYALNTFALTAIASWIVKVGEQIGFEHERINTAFGIILVVTGLLGTFFGGRLASLLAARSKDPAAYLLRFVGISSIVASPLLAWSFLSDNHAVFLISCALAELVVFAGVAPINSVLVSECPPALVTLTQGVTITTINLLGTLPGPWLTGMLADQIGLRTAMQLSTFALLACGILWWAGGIRLRRA